MVGYLKITRVFMKSEFRTRTDIDFLLINVHLRITGEEKTSKHAVLKYLDLVLSFLHKDS